MVGPWSPSLFTGEELGLEEARVSADRQLDPDGRDRSRAPIPWTSQPPVIQAAREKQGLVGLDQVKFAVLERSGGISIIPR